MNTKVKIGERVQRLVMVIGRGTHPRRELMAALGLRQESRRNFYDNYMKPATARGLVTMQCPGHPSIPEQTYRLTEKGLEFWEELSKKEQAMQGNEWERENWRSEFKKGTGYARELVNEWVREWGEMKWKKEQAVRGEGMLGRVSGSKKEQAIQGS